MIANYAIQPDGTGTQILNLTWRKSVAQEFITEKKKFVSVIDAKIELKRRMKAILLDQLTAFVGHCGNIMEASLYPKGPRWQAYQKCRELVRYCKGGNGDKTMKEVATFILMNKNNLEKILPYAANKGRETAEGNFVEIIAQARNYSKRKRVTQMVS